MRRLRKQPRRSRNDRDFDLEAGDRVYTWVHDGRLAVMDDLVESRGRNKRDAGILTPQVVKKNGRPRYASLINSVWYWV